MGKIQYLFILLLFTVHTSLFGLDSFEFNLNLTEKENKVVLYELNGISVKLKNNKLNKEVKYHDILVKSLYFIKDLEKQYKNKEIYQIKTIIDSNNHEWTFSIRVTSKDTSVTHFILFKKDTTVEGWINRNNKDLFGLRILNF